MSLNEMDCNELVELVTAYLDNALDEETRARFEAHLTECDGCRTTSSSSGPPFAPSARSATTN